MKPRRGLDLLIGIAVLALPISASADYFFLYVKCNGEVSSPKGRQPANLDLALRDNNQTALIQRSNVLPVGDKMRYEVSPAAYSMTYRSPQARTQLYYDWYRGALFAWDPSLKRLAYIRVSIDRQTGNLEGDYRNADDTILATFSMRCEKADPNTLAPPKF